MTSGTVVATPNDGGGLVGRKKSYLSQPFRVIKRVSQKTQPNAVMKPSLTALSRAERDMRTIFMARSARGRAESEGGLEANHT